jgi:putative transposase
MKHIANQRNNFLDNLSVTLIKNHDLVVAENLSSKNMLKNHALAKSISDVGWRTFIQKLTYKSELYGKTFLTVDPKNTTQTCNDCGYVMGSDDKSERLSLRNREWTCLNCGEFHIRDHNAAKNILQKGQLALA